jgi:hypothetical protein
LAGKMIIVDENVSMEYHLTKAFELVIFTKFWFEGIHKPQEHVI